MDLHIVLSIIIVVQALIISSLLINGLIRPIKDATSDHRRAIGESDMNPLNKPIQKELSQ